MFIEVALMVVCLCVRMVVCTRYVVSLKKRDSFLKTHASLADKPVSAHGKAGHGKGGS